MVDPYEAELAEQAASGGSGSTLGGGFNFSGSSGSSNISTSSDDGGDSYVPGQGISLTKAKQEYIPGRGVTFSMPSASDKQRQQRLSGMGDYQNSQQYKDYLTATGRSLKNPFGNTGIVAGIFGADKVSLFNPDDPMQRQQAQNILDIGFDRYMNFDQQPEYAQSKGFGKLFGGPEGEMTVQGELRAQVPETTTTESLLRDIIPGASFLPTPGTTYAPMGSTSYDPERDPSANQDLRSGPFSLLTDALSKGKKFISDRLNPLPDAPPSRPRQPVQETRRDIIDTRTPEFELENNPNLVADASQFINPMLQFFEDDPLKFNIGDGTIKFTPEGDLKRGPTGGRFEYNLPLQDKDLGLGNLFRMFG